MEGKAKISPGVQCQSSHNEKQGAEQLNTPMHTCAHSRTHTHAMGGSLKFQTEAGASCPFEFRLMAPPMKRPCLSGQRSILRGQRREKHQRTEVRCLQRRKPPHGAHCLISQHTSSCWCCGRRSSLKRRQTGHFF